LTAINLLLDLLTFLLCLTGTLPHAVRAVVRDGRSSRASGQYFWRGEWDISVDKETNFVSSMCNNIMLGYVCHCTQESTLAASKDDATLWETEELALR
jgi:hypothetical protein